MAKRPQKEPNEKFSDKESKRRFEAALLGAKLASNAPRSAAPRGRKAKKRPPSRS